MAGAGGPTEAGTCGGKRTIFLSNHCLRKQHVFMNGLFSSPAGHIMKLGVIFAVEIRNNSLAMRRLCAER